MKKRILVLLILVASLSLVACGNSEKKEETKGAKAVVESKEKDEKVLKVGDVWEVDGQWKLTIDSVTTTSERNEFSDKKPSEVVIVKYTYENLGYEDDMQDLFLVPDEIVDGNGEMGEIYPADIQVYPKETPIGSKTVGAEEAFGLNNVSDTVQVIFKTYDGNKKQQKITFECEVTK